MENKPSYAELEEIVQNQNRWIRDLIKDKKFWYTCCVEAQKEAGYYLHKYLGVDAQKPKKPATHLKLVHPA